MAKQIGPVKITGTLGDLTFYQLNGEFYVKSTSRISKRRLKQDPCFARFRRAQERFKTASLLVKSVYYTIAKEKRYNGLYAKLVGQALPLVKQEVAAEAILSIIMAPFAESKPKPSTVTATSQPKTGDLQPDLTEEYISESGATNQQSLLSQQITLNQIEGGSAADGDGSLECRGSKHQGMLSKQIILSLENRDNTTQNVDYIPAAEGSRQRAVGKLFYDPIRGQLCVGIAGATNLAPGDSG